MTVTYVDASVVLAWLLAEDVRPDPGFWRASSLVTSRLTEYETWVRLHAYGYAERHGVQAVEVLACMDAVELHDAACARARAAFPEPVRTLDALHLATADFLRTRGLVVRLATYDARMRRAAVAMGFALAEV